MPLDIVHKSFIVNRASGNQVVTGMGISGKAFIFYGANSSGNTLALRGDNYWLSMGFAEVMSSGNSVITQNYASMRDSDSEALAVSLRHQGNSGMLVYTGNTQSAITNSLERRGSMVAVDGDGFTINWVNIPGIAATSIAPSGYVHVDIFGGSDIVNAKVGNFTAFSGHGTQSVSGIGFAGNMVFFASAALPASSFNVLSGQTFGQMALGMAGDTDGQNPTDNATTVMSEHGPTTMDTWRTQRTTRGIILMTTSGTAYANAQVGDFTADGFDIVWTSGTGLIGECQINYLVMQISGNVDVGDFDLMSGTGNQSISGVGFSGKYVRIMGYNTRGGTATAQANNRITIGSATSGSQRGCIWCGSEDNVGTSITAKAHVDDALIVMCDELATASGSTVMFNADFVDFHSDGFTINRITNPFSGDYSGASFGFVVIGDIITAPPVVAVEDVNRRAFGAGKINATYMQDFGTFQSVNSNSRAIFGPALIPTIVNVSGSLI